MLMFPTQYTNVHIHLLRFPIAYAGDFATAEWPNVDGVKDMYFRNCAMNTNPQYQVRGIVLTDTAPSITIPAATPNPTHNPTEAPTTAHPTTSPIESPSSSPTVPYWPVWEDAADSNTIEDASTTCFAQKDRLGITVNSNEFGDYFTVSPDPWVSGGINFGCQLKENNICIKSCHPFDTTYPDWSAKLFLTFHAKVEGESPGCKPSVTLTGGAWVSGVGYRSSNKIYLEDSYVDTGSLSSTEFRRVAIPLSDMKTVDWNLSSTRAIYFQTCGFNAEGSAYPRLTYHISSLAVTNHVIDVVSMPPTESPTPYVTDDPLLATHRTVHHHWYPILGADREPAGEFAQLG